MSKVFTLVARRSVPSREPPTPTDEREILSLCLSTRDGLPSSWDIVAELNRRGYHIVYVPGSRVSPPPPEAAPAQRPSEELTFAAFSEANRARCEATNGFNHRLDSWSRSDWFMAIVGELGEAASVGKKLNRIRDGIPGNKETEVELREKFRAEIADGFIYLDLIAQASGFTLGEVVPEVFNRKSEQIGYPVRLGLGSPSASSEPPDEKEESK